MGLPSMALANEKHEIKTIKHFESNGATINLGYVGHTNIDKISVQINKFISNRDHINKISSNAFKLKVNIDSSRVYKIIEKYIIQ